MGDQKNLLLAILASLVVLLGFQLLFPSRRSPLKVIMLKKKNDSFAPDARANCRKHLKLEMK